MTLDEIQRFVLDALHDERLRLWRESTPEAEAVRRRAIFAYRPALWLGRELVGAESRRFAFAVAAMERDKILKRILGKRRVTHLRALIFATVDY